MITHKNVTIKHWYFILDTITMPS